MRTGRNGMVPGAIIALMLLIASGVAARAELRIVSSPGGEVESYLRLFAMVRQSGERVIIDGPCLSACTLVLSAIPEDRICITRRAVLGFHAARWLDQQGQLYAAPDETRLLVTTYPAPIRSWIERNGGLTEKPLFMRSRQLAALYRSCR
jgi:ATP-dependent protease ClpP protease subunit